MYRPDKLGGETVELSLFFGSCQNILLIKRLNVYKVVTKLQLPEES